jgi:protein-L-isoaspartate(D-aspartate) O-methyltransferase
MVDEQLIPRGINNKRVLEAFYKVERHKFIPDDLGGLAYADNPLPIGGGQTISQPYIVALMSQYLDLGGEERVLEIGTGSGYQAAILAELSGQVYTVERIESLSLKACNLLNELGYKNIQFKIGDGTLGWPEGGQFDRIIVTAAGPRIPMPLVEQLKDQGKMILPLGEALGQSLTLTTKVYGKLQSVGLCGCVFVPLVGKFGLSS